MKRRVALFATNVAIAILLAGVAMTEDAAATVGWLDCCKCTTEDFAFCCKDCCWVTSDCPDGSEDCLQSACAPEFE
jgi:hypothetical protein